MVNRENIKKILAGLPEGVQLVAAAKTRSTDEILEAISSGIKIIGENYLQEAEVAYAGVGKVATWHFIGHLQKNKVKRAVRIFDMIETVDSVEVAKEIDKRCSQIGKVMPVLIEINSGKEKQKSGVLSEDAEQLVRELAGLENIRVMGLMTMGPGSGNPEDSRPYFVATKQIYEKIRKLALTSIEMRYLSMGMSNSYRIAIEEGANIVRLGTLIFGERDYG